MSKWGGAPRFASLRLTLFWGFGNTNRDSFCFFIVDIIYVNASNEEKIKKGAYKGLYGWQRDLIRVTPLLNSYYNMTNPKEKLDNLQNTLNR